MSLLSRSRSSSVSTVLTRTGPDRKSPYSRSNVRPDVEDVRMSLEVVIRVQAVTRLYVSATSPRLRGLVALSNPTSGTICGRASRWVVYQLIVIHIKNAALAPTELGGCRNRLFRYPRTRLVRQLFKILISWW